MLAAGVLLGCGGQQSAPRPTPSPAKTAAIATTPRPTTVTTPQPAPAKTAEPPAAKTETLPQKTEVAAKTEEKRSPKNLPLGR